MSPPSYAVHSDPITIPGSESPSADPYSTMNPASLRETLLSPATPKDDPTTIDRYNTIFSPVFSHLPTIKPSLLHTASPQSQALRRKLLRGANLLLIQGGGRDKAFIYDRLRTLGVNVYVIDNPSSPWRAAAADGKLAGFLEVDFSNSNDIFRRVMDALYAAPYDLDFDAVTTYYEDAVAVAARVADALGVATNTPDACDSARNKRRTREAMRDAGLPVPRFARVLEEADIAPACEQVGFPAVLKPVYGAASMGVVRVESVEQAVACYRKLFGTLDVTNDTIWSQGTEMVLEEYYDGDEFDVDMLLSDGEVVYAKVSDNWACWEPWFQETGTHCPSTYPAEKQAELVRLAVDTTLALGFKYGCFHVECRYTSRGPRLIEVNARMGGDPIYDFNLLAWGVDLVEEHAMSALRIPIRPMVPERPLRFVAEAVFNAPYSGRMTCDGWLDFLEGNAMVHRIDYFKGEGDEVVGPEDGVPDWLAEIVVVSEKSQEEANEMIREIVEDKAVVPITAKREGAERGFFFPSHAYPFSP